MNKLRIGLTMRISESVGYSEKRDAIAHDWSNFIMKNLPDCKWMLLPNVGSGVCNIAKQWNINAFIFTGGEDIGKYELRDKTEFHLLDYALNNNFPVLGICRGMQLIYKKFGGEIGKGANDFIKIHRANNHLIEINNEFKTVNSYHDNFLIKSKALDKFEIIAKNVEDSTVEGICKDNVLGLMWHPERDSEHSDWVLRIIKKALNV